MENSLNEMLSTEFRLDPKLIYLNHAAVSPWPCRTTQAVSGFAQENNNLGSHRYLDWLNNEQFLRSQLAELINAPSTDDIALLKNTSEALSVVAYGLDWRPGDNIVISSQEFPSNRIVWQSLERFGVEIRQVPLNINSPEINETLLIEHCDRNTRLLSISSIQFASGIRHQLELLGEYCRTNGILYCIDAIQSVAAMQFDVQAIQADFVMADAHKWMLGPEGIALFYCSKLAREKLKLHQFGWHMVENMEDFDSQDWQPAKSARRFECGSPNMIGIHALSASLSLIQEIGVEKIEALICQKSKWIMDQLCSYSRYELLTPTKPNFYGGIVSFKDKQTDSKKLYQYLVDNNVVCAMRGGGIRVSPHFYTSGEVLERFITLLISA